MWPSRAASTLAFAFLPAIVAAADPEPPDVADALALALCHHRAGATATPPVAGITAIAPSGWYTCR